MRNTYKILILISFIFLVKIAFAQDSDKKHTHKNKLSIGVIASPDLYIMDFKTKGLNVPTYKTQLNYSLGGTIIYHPIKLITLRVAVLYTTKGYSIDYTADASKPSAADLPQTANFDLRYLDVPLMANLNLIHKDHIQLFVSAGFIPSILIQKTGESIQKDKSIKETDLSDINNFFAGTTYSFGVKYNLTNWLGVGAEPYFRYYLNKIDDVNMAKAPLSFGGKVSMVINFNHY